MTHTGKMNSNGQRVFGRGVDNRGSGSKKVKKYIREFTDALGGEDRLNCGELHVIKRLAALHVLAERQEGMLITNDPKYSADEHMRNVGKIKLITDDLDFPPKRQRPRSTPDPELPEDDGLTFEEYLSLPETIASTKRKRTRL